MAKYSLDIDGVVADFYNARAAVAKTLHIRSLTQPVGLSPEDLDVFMQERQAAITNALRKYIMDDLESFYGGLDSLVSKSDLQAIHRASSMGYEVFWVSARSFIAGQVFSAELIDELSRITLAWLLKNDLPADSAHVVLTMDKASVIRDKNIRFHLDDLVPHVTSIALQTSAKVFLLRRPWNQRFVVTHPGQPNSEDSISAGAYGVEEVDSIAEFITLMQAGA